MNGSKTIICLSNNYATAQGTTTTADFHVNDLICGPNEHSQGSILNMPSSGCQYIQNKTWLPLLQLNSHSLMIEQYCCFSHCVATVTESYTNGLIYSPRACPTGNSLNVSSSTSMHKTNLGCHCCDSILILS